MTKPRILLADDHTLVLEGFKRILQDQCELVGMVQNGRALLEIAAEQRPDIIFLDISMPLLNGIDAARQLRQRLPGVKIIFVTMHADPAYVAAAFKAGAAGYLLKRSAFDELEQAIKAVLSGNFYVTPLITKDVVGGMLTGASDQPLSFEDLTVRQREVLQLLAEGHSVKETAKVLSISPRTVEFHKAQIMAQLNLHTTVELVKYAMTHGLIPAS